MANLIITVIAIALVAIASLMGAYYGGSAFLNNQSAANASTVLNQAQQVSGAWNAYLSDNLNTPPTANGLNSLTTGNYLAQIPTAPAEAGGTLATAMSAGSANATINGVAAVHYFAYANMGVPGATPGIADNNAAACMHIVKTATGAAATAVFATATNAGAIFNKANVGNGTFGCAKLGTGPTALANSVAPVAGDYVMEYLLQ